MPSLSRIAILATFFVSALHGITNAEAAPVCADLFTSAPAPSELSHTKTLASLEQKFGFDIQLEFTRLTSADHVVELDGGFGGFALESAEFKKARATVVSKIDLETLASKRAARITALGGRAVKSHRIDEKSQRVDSIGDLPRHVIAQLGAAFRMPALGAIASPLVFGHINDEAVALYAARVLRRYVLAVESGLLANSPELPKDSATLLIDSGDRLAKTKDPLQTFGLVHAALKLGGRAYFDLSKADAMTFTIFQRLAQKQPHAFRLEEKRLIYTRQE